MKSTPRRPPQPPRPNRTFVAATILILWVGGLAWLGLREINKPRSELLAQGAQNIAPVTYYYMVERDGENIGSAFSGLDTVGPRIIASDFYRGQSPLSDETKDITARSVASLTRGFALTSFRVQLLDGGKPLTITGKPPAKSTLLLPSLLPVAYMLSGASNGESQNYWVYNPIARHVEEITLKTRAESLFTVVDSAMYDSVATNWVPAHTDTIRAWQMNSDKHQIIAWIDAQGRIVTATGPRGLRVTRTAYEIAFRNRRNSKGAK